MQIVLIAIIVYILIVFAVSRFVIPYLGFSPVPIPKEIPVEMESVIQKIKSESSDSLDFLVRSFEFIGNKYRTGRLETLLRFNYLYMDYKEAWKRSGFIPCTLSNYILRIFLVKSGYFKDEEVKYRHMFFNFLIHQYLKVLVDGKWIIVDAGEKNSGVQLGQKIGYFHFKY